MRLLAALLAVAALAHGATLAYNDRQERALYKPANGPAKVVPGRRPYQLSLSPDGKRLLAAIDIQPIPKRKLILWDPATGQTRDLISGYVALPRWSPDGRSIAYVEDRKDTWQLFVMPASDASQARLLNTREVVGIVDWTPDGQALVVFSNQDLLWIGLDGKVRRSIPLAEIYSQQFDSMSNDVLRLDPANPNRLAVSAQYTDEPKGAALDEMDRSSTIFLYDLTTRKRTVVVPPSVWAYQAVWSPDGTWLYFTRQEKGRMSIWRVHPDGSGLEFVVAGSGPEVAP